MLNVSLHLNISKSCPALSLEHTEMSTVPSQAVYPLLFWQTKNLNTGKTSNRANVLGTKVEVPILLIVQT